MNNTKGYAAHKAPRMRLRHSASSAGRYKPTMSRSTSYIVGSAMNVGKLRAVLDGSSSRRDRRIQPRVSTLIIIHNLSAGSGHKPSATIDCLESIARWCQQIQAGSICFQPVSSVDYGWFGFLSGGNDFGLSRMYCSKRSS
jgi:hypothetical protein